MRCAKRGFKNKGEEKTSEMWFWRRIGGSEEMGGTNNYRGSVGYCQRKKTRFNRNEWKTVDEKQFW